MTKYPLEEKIHEFMETRRGVLADISWKNLDRRFRRINREMIVLKENNRNAMVTCEVAKKWFNEHPEYKDIMIK